MKEIAGAMKARRSTSASNRSTTTEVSLETEIGRMARSAAVRIKAPSVTAPLTDELHGNLRALKTKSTFICEHMHAKQFALDPQLKMKQLLRPADSKPKKQARPKVKVVPRYRDDPRYFT